MPPLAAGHGDILEERSSSSSSSSSNRTRPPPTALRRYVLPFGLLCVVTSLAFNRARIARQRDEEHRRYLIQTRILSEELAALRGLHPWRRAQDPDHDAAFAKRCLTAGLDPTRCGVAVAVPAASGASPTGGMVPGGDSTESIKWSEALFGKGTLQRMGESLVRAATVVKQTVIAGSGVSPKKSVDEKEEQEWEKAFEAYVAAAERVDPPKPSLRPDPVADSSSGTPPLPAQSAAEAWSHRSDVTDARRSVEQQMGPPADAQSARRGKMFI
ncbi:unnamed protein product [Parajaminaea phylloscopi]